MAQQAAQVTVEQFYINYAEELHLTLMAGANGLRRRIREGSVNRPGLALEGFYKYFAHKRVQVIGAAEQAYLKSLSRIGNSSSLSPRNNTPCSRKSQ